MLTPSLSFIIYDIDEEGDDMSQMLMTALIGAIAVLLLGVGIALFHDAIHTNGQDSRMF